MMGLIMVLWGALSPLAHASTVPGSVPVAWDRNPESNVTGYKVYWGRTSRIYEQTADAGNNPQALLSNLTPGQPYYCAVTAYNADGQESAYSAEITVMYGTAPENPDPSGRLVMVEAEDGQLNSPMAVFSGTTESWVDTSTYSQLGWTQMTFNAPVSGDYQVWCRVKAPTASKDSFFVTTDAGVEDVFHVYGTPNAADTARSSEWIWKRIHVTDAGPRVYTLGQGSHTIRFRVREPGTLLDRIVVSSDPAFVPSDSLPRSGDAVVVTGTSGNLTAAPGSSATLAVTAAATSGPVGYQWFKDGIAIPDATASLLSLQGLSTSNSGSYTVQLTAGTATTTSSAMVLSVSDSATLLPKLQVTRFTIKADRSVSFEVDGGMGSNIQIQASSDMVNWELIGTQLNEFGVIDIADPAAVAGATRRFYRLVGSD